MTQNHSPQATPWGSWEVLLDSADCKVKRIIVRPQQRLSYQKHFKRSETWVVVNGVATVTLDGSTHAVRSGEVIQIPLQAAHRVANYETSDLVLIEVQQGSYFGEDDILRLDDDYGRQDPT